MDGRMTEIAPRTAPPGQVRDIMQHQVVTIGPDATVRVLADLLLKHEVSGVPVIGKDGLVEGVVSLWDVVRMAATDGSHPELIWLSEGPPGAEGQSGFFGSLIPSRPTSSPLLKTIRPPLLERHTVREIMTPAIFYVREDLSIPDLAAYLLASKIHRALVMGDGKLLGIVTTMDVLEAIARQEVEA